MRYNQLGVSDLKLSHVSLGGATFSNIYGNFEEEKSFTFIKEALSRGVNYIETGYWYGQGTSEKTIGKALKSVPRKHYYIGSKVGRYEKDTANMFDFSAEKTNAAVDNTLQRLQMDYVDLIQIHDVTFAPDMNVILKETLPALEQAVRDGKARYIGIADYDIELMQEIVEESDVKISSVLSYAKSTIFDNRLQNHVKYFKSKGVGVINAAATGMGLLSNTGPQPWHPASDDVKAICREASEFCKARNVELARLATWFTLSQPGIDTNICGFTNIEQMTDTLVLLETGLTVHEQSVLAEVQTRQSKGVGVINAAATGMGLLSNTGPQPWHPASDDVKAICREASEFCKARNVELARLATWFTLSQPGIDTNICGFTNIEQMTDTLVLLETGLTVHEQSVLAEVQTRFFDKGVLHWDGVELPAHRAKLDELQAS